MASAVAANAARPPRNVTTAVLFDPGAQKVLLVKRSEKVSTYKHHWAFISGSMEKEDKDPLFRATTEILEETTLAGPDLKLVRAGRPQRIFDAGRLRFIVHPFLFHLSPGAAEKVRLDWEHEDQSWVSLQDVQNHQTVPDLATTITRVWVPREIGAGLDSLTADRTSGAQEMLVSAVELLKKASSSEMINECAAISPFKTKEAALSHLVDTAYLIRQARPGMASAMGSGMSSALAELKEKLDGLETAKDVFAALPGILECRLAEKAAGQERLEEVFSDLVGKVMSQRQANSELGILTHSASSTILRCLMRASKSFKLHVYVTESRPLFEGVGLAAKLASAGIPTTVLTDAAVLHLLLQRKVGLVVLGSDQLLVPSDSRPNGGAVNKIGSALLSLAANYARERGVDVRTYIVSSTEKLNSSEPHDETNDAVELAASWKEAAPNGVEVVNPYFEEIPGDFIAGYVTEKGVLDSSSLRKLWAGRETQEQIWDF